mmetsp:Transcript_18985/g.41251  ORF Transcript_18985/g.41251 Transcript_18985/m.41251 type:complete len:248 (+) Transcript_18985:143-886(+)
MTCLGGITTFSASSVSSSKTLWTTSLTFFSIPSASWSTKSMHFLFRILHSSRMALMRFFSCSGVVDCSSSCCCFFLANARLELDPNREPGLPLVVPAAPASFAVAMRPLVASSLACSSVSSRSAVWHATSSWALEGVRSTASCSLWIAFWRCWRVASSRRASRTVWGSGSCIQSLAHNLGSLQSWLAQYNSLVRLLFLDSNTFLITQFLSMWLNKQKLTEASLTGAIFFFFFLPPPIVMTWISSLTE